MRIDRRDLLLMPAAALLGVRGAAAQILPPDADQPVEVLHGRGELAGRLAGKTIPRGKEWKAVMDAERMLQIMLPKQWKVDTRAEGTTVMTAVASSEGPVPAQLQVTFDHPADEDPLTISEAFALSFPEKLAELPAMKLLEFKPLDRGWVHARGMKFALAGGTAMAPLGGGRKVAVHQAQICYIAEDRLIVVQFAAPEKDWSSYLEDLAGVMASYVTIGRRQASSDME